MKIFSFGLYYLYLYTACIIARNKTINKKEKYAQLPGLTRNKNMK